MERLLLQARLRGRAIDRSLNRDVLAVRQDDLLAREKQQRAYNDILGLCRSEGPQPHHINIHFSRRMAISVSFALSTPF